MSFSYVKLLPVGKTGFSLVVGVQVVDDGAGQSAFEAAQRFTVEGAGVESFAVVGLATANTETWLTPVTRRWRGE
jgi:hypothetical protein